MQIWPFPIYINFKKGLAKVIKQTIEAEIEIELSRLIENSFKTKKNFDEYTSGLDLKVLDIAKPYLQLNFDLTYNLLERFVEGKKTAKYVENFLNDFYKLDEKQDERGFELFEKMSQLSDLKIDELRQLSWCIMNQFKVIDTKKIDNKTLKKHKKAFDENYFQNQAHLDYIANLSSKALEVLQVRTMFMPPIPDKDDSWEKTENYLEGKSSSQFLDKDLDQADIEYYRHIIAELKKYEEKNQVNLATYL